MLIESELKPSATVRQVILARETIVPSDLVRGEKALMFPTTMLGLSRTSVAISCESGTTFKQDSNSYSLDFCHSSVVPALEARVAGSAVIANNLAARLDGVRADALYARVLFLFLGVPGIVLALLVTFAVAASGSDRRRREQALLRIRGASLLQVLGLAGTEAAASGLLAIVLGLALAGTTAIAWWHLASLGLAIPWFALAAGVGFVLAMAAFLVPAWRDAKLLTVSAARLDANQQ